MLTSPRYQDRSRAAEETIRSAFLFENDTSGPGGPWGFLGTQLPEGQSTVATMLKSAG